MLLFLLLFGKGRAVFAQADKLVLQEENNFLFCQSSGSEFATRFSVPGNADLTDFEDGSFSVEFGDGNSENALTVAALKSGVAHTYHGSAEYQVVFSGRTKGGDVVSRTYSLKAYNRPTSNLAIVDPNARCLGSEITYVVNMADEAFTEKYSIDFDDGTPIQTYTVQELKTSGGKVTHTYNMSYCHPWHPGSSKENFTIKLTVQNACFSRDATNQEYVAEPINAKFSFDQLAGGKLCTFEKAHLRNLTSGGTGEDCEPTQIKWKWVFSDGTTSNEYQPDIEFGEPGSYNIKLIATNNSYACAADSTTESILVIERVKADFTVPADTICAGTALTFTNKSSGDVSKPFRWSVVSLDGRRAPASPAQGTIHPGITFPDYGTYRVSLYVENDCSNDRKDTIITVRKDPEVTQLDIPAEICPPRLNLQSYVRYVWNGNTPAPEWTITRDGGMPNTGFVYASGTGPASEYPVPDFDTPGDYTVTVALKTVGCPAGSLTRTASLRVLDPKIVRNLTSTMTDICEGGTVSFTSTSAGQNLKHAWSLSPMSNTAFVDGNQSSSGPVIRFDKFGDYDVRLRLSVVCNAVDTTIRVHVRKEPHLAHLALKSAVCPDEIMDFRNYTIYNFYNNPEQAQWSVTPSTGFEYIGGTGATSAYPVIQFRDPGTYIFTVKLAGVGCSTDGAVQERKDTVKVRNSAMTLSLEALETALCEGDNLAFSMTGKSAEDDPLLYQWSVVPEDPSGDFAFLEYGNDQSVTKIQFNTWGTYRVRGEVSGYCGTLDSTVTVTTRKSPEVRLRDTAICPGVVDLSEYVSYVWYNNRQEVTWEITAVGATPPDGYDYTNGADVNTLYPQIDFKKKGEYVVRASLSSVGCEENFLQARGNFTVYDTAIVINAEPAGSTDICEGTELHFRNLSTGQGLKWHWEVERTGGTDGTDTYYAFTQGTGKDRQASVIRFDRYGEYTVTLTIDGTCNRKTVSWPVTVRGVPDIDLKERMQSLCAGAATVDLKEYIEYTDLKNNHVSYYWDVQPSTGVSFQNGAQDTEFPVITFSQHNQYTVKLEATTQCGPAPWMESKSRINVLDGKFRAVFETDTMHCLSDKPWLVNRSEGDSLTYRWSVAPRTASGGGWKLTGGGATAAEPELELSETGSYDVTLAVENLCGTDDTTLTIRAFSVPEIDVRDISGVCEPFVFRAADRVTVNENNDAPYFAEWSVTPNEDIEHFNSSQFYPDIRFPAGEYKVQVTYRNNCSQPGTAAFIVRVDEFIPVTLPADTAVCVRTEPFRLTASPDTGRWRSTAGNVIRRPDGYYFDPDFSPYFEGTIPVIYELQNHSCLATDSLQVYVRPLPRVSAGDSQQMCLNHEPLALTGESPAGGYWTYADHPLSGGAFPAVAEGDYPVVYHYADLYHCVNTDTAVVTVHPLPVTGFAVDPQPCIHTEVLLEPDRPENTFRWDFGDGAGGEHTGNTLHTYTGYGFRDIRAEVVSVHGCVDSAAPRRIEVINVAPPALFDINSLSGCGPFEAVLAVDETAYADDHNYLTFRWDYGDGTTSDTLLPVSPRIYDAEAWDTTFTLSFTVGNKCTQSTWDTVINVGSRPKASFVLQHRWECSPVPVEVQNTTTGNRSKFSWDMGDGTVFGDIRNPFHEFTTTDRSAIYYITLTAINPCGRDVHTDSLIIKPRTLSAHFTPEKTYACVGEELHFRNNSTDTLTLVENTYWDFGDGSRDSLWHVSHAYRQAGTYPVRLWIENGCGFDTITDRITVYPPPQLAILGEKALCEESDFHFSYQSDQVLKKVDWNLGDGWTDTRDSLVHRYAGYGKFNVTLTGVSAHMSACRTSVVQAVEVYNKPIVAILPEDTVACSPFLYKPEVTVTGHAALLWDFGDQPGQSSLGEYRYINDTYRKQEFTVKIYAETDKGCTSEYERGVSVYPLPSAGIGKQVTKGKPEKVLYLNRSEEAAESFWIFPDGHVLYSSESVEADYDENGLYVMGLVAKNAYGCPDTAWLEHKVLFRGLHFPNTFIPHSRNEKNNLFNGIGMSLSEYHLEIYDQYQNKIWETRELQNGKPSGGWDGTSANGERMPQGIYLWRAKAIFLDDTVWTGENNDSGVVQTVQGTVLLLRE
jgi:PKD repeat protein